MADRWVNRDAVEWTLWESDVGGDQLPVMIVVASFTNAEGRGAYPARSLIAKLARRSARQVVRDLAELVKRGQLQPGDWHLVLHIRADRRPNPYDLPDAFRDWLARRASTSPRGSRRGVRTSPRERPRGDIHDMNGVTSATERGDMVSPEEFMKNSGKGERADAQPPAASTAPPEDQPVRPAHRTKPTTEAEQMLRALGLRRASDSPADEETTR